MIQRERGAKIAPAASRVDSVTTICIMRALYAAPRRERSSGLPPFLFARWRSRGFARKRLLLTRVRSPGLESVYRKWSSHLKANANCRCGNSSKINTRGKRLSTSLLMRVEERRSRKRKKNESLKVCGVVSSTRDLVFAFSCSCFSPTSVKST